MQVITVKQKMVNTVIRKWGEVVLGVLERRNKVEWR